MTTMNAVLKTWERRGRTVRVMRGGGGVVWCGGDVAWCTYRKCLVRYVKVVLRHVQYVQEVLSSVRKRSVASCTVRTGSALSYT